MGFGASKCICPEQSPDKDGDGGTTNNKTEPKANKSKMFAFSPLKKQSPLPSMGKVERSLKAALLIQRWYRRYEARLEIRRRYTWSIFQSIEYAGEQDQMKLHNFFNALLEHMGTGAGSGDILGALSPRSSPVHGKSTALKNQVDPVASPDDFIVESGYKGPHINTPLTTDSIHQLIDAFKKKKTLHVKYVCVVMLEAVAELKSRATLVHASTALSGQITVCGDLHGKLDDLLTILYKNGLPSVDNPYVFNGDFVDRGKKSLEVILLLLALLIVFPKEMFLNRGNHEDMVMNARYGFCKEVNRKYKGPCGPKILRLLEEVYRWLPLGTIIDHKVLVVHGGISDQTDLDLLTKADRSKYISVLRTPAANVDNDAEVRDNTDDNEDFLQSVNHEWKQILDLLWSDPQSALGCTANTFRGGGSYFGPDVTKEVLGRHGLSRIIRSHECKLEGYEHMHNETCLTIFSASNYYEAGSNRGAYVKLAGPDLQEHFVQYMADTKCRQLTIRERVGRMEASAFRELRTQITASKSKLIKAFEVYDKNNSGYIDANDWVSVMEEQVQLELPWRVLKDNLVTCKSSGEVAYNTTFKDTVQSHSNLKSGVTVVEALYRHKSSLETIFRLIDKDNSGFISYEEFNEACALISRHIDVPIPPSDINDMATSMDINKDGHIDFNEFLECFRIVHTESKDTDEDDDEEED